jgi:glycosyltransferase involved in cell wall biosynthesis
MGREVVFVAGRDPRFEISGGHSAYVRSYARAAIAAGYEPHLFCAAPDSRVEETAFGVVHRVASPVRPFRQMVAGAHAPWVARSIVRFALAAPARRQATAGDAAAAGGRARLLVHGFGVWGCIAVRAVADLRRLGRDAVAVVSSYTTYEDEARAKVLGSCGYGARRQLQAGLEHLWVRLAVERWERRAYLGADRVLLNYESVRRLVAAKYGDAARCQRLPYTCEAAFLRPGGAAHEALLPEPPELPDLPELPEIIALGGGAPGRHPPLVVAVARHDPRKGQDVLLRALALLHAGGVPVRACLVGGGPLLDVHRRLAAELGLDGVVAILGAVPEVLPYLAAADLFVLPSRTEQSGSLALLEALLSGKAVIASAVDGIPEDVTDGEDALLVPPDDPAALAAALRRALGDPGLRARLARRAAQTFAARFAPAVVAAALRELYTGLGAPP